MIFIRKYERKIDMFLECLFIKLLYMTGFLEDDLFVYRFLDGVVVGVVCIWFYFLFLF